MDEGRSEEKAGWDFPDAKSKGRIFVEIGIAVALIAVIILLAVKDKKSQKALDAQEV